MRKASASPATPLGAGNGRRRGLVNTTIAVADSPVMMATAFRLAVEAGLLARQAVQAKLAANPRNPLTGFLEAFA